MTRARRKTPAAASWAWLKDPAKLKAGLWVLGILLAALGTVSAGLFNRVKTLQETTAAVTLERDRALASSRTTTAKILELERSRKTSESRYKNLLLARNPVTGEPLFDRDGRPLYDTFEGSAEAVEELVRNVERLQVEVVSLQETVRIRDHELVQLRARTSGPARSPWSGHLAYDAPVATWLTPGTAVIRAGAGYRLLQLLGLDISPTASLGYDLGLQALRVSVGLQLQP